MITTEQADEILRTISQAWGPEDNEGYCFFPWVEGEKRSFRTKSFQWPSQRSDIIAHMQAHEGHDLYWCPMLFDSDARRVEHAQEEYSLWADLDESDPNKIPRKWKPSVAWETSPGRYQALWLLEDPEIEDLYGASKKGADNQRMTYMVDADPSGWDTTQLLRLPGWTNHKPQYEDDEGEYPTGRLLWDDGPRYVAKQFDRLPAIPDIETDVEIDPELFENIDGIVAGEVLDRVRSLLPKTVPERMENGPEGGEDRSRPMFYFMRCLADVGCSVQEIVAVIRESKWNKFRGRVDEIEQLSAQATTAWKKRKKSLSEQVDYSGVLLDDFISSAVPPHWLVKDMITRGSVGFIGGEPKARKSWVALDLAMSVAATAATHHTKFLDKFSVHNPGPVLYFVLEDGQYLFTQRAKQVWESKTKYDGVRLRAQGRDVQSDVKGEHKTELPMVIIHNQKVNLSDEGSMALVQDRIREGYTYSDGTKSKFALVIIDTLMRSTGGADINSMSEMMNGILDPLTRMAKRHRSTILLVHHFGKSKPEGEVRGGTRLLGSQALHAWAEDSLYLTAREHGFVIELESKTAPTNRWEFRTDPTQRTWSPRYTLDVGGEIHFAEVQKPKKQQGPPKALVALRSLDLGPHTTKEVADVIDWGVPSTHRALTRLTDQGKVTKVGTLWQLP